MATYIYEFSIVRKGRVWIDLEHSNDSCDEAYDMAENITALLEKDEAVQNIVLGKPEVEFEEIMNRVGNPSVNDWNGLCEDDGAHELKVYENDDYFFNEVINVRGHALTKLIAKSPSYDPDDAYVNITEDGRLISSDDPMDLVEVTDLMPTYEEVMKGAKK